MKQTQIKKLGHLQAVIVALKRWLNKTSPIAPYIREDNENITNKDVVIALAYTIAFFILLGIAGNFDK